MTQRTRRIAHLMLAVATAAILAGCARGKEFQGVPQEGAVRTGKYPTFGHMPKAATTQFTPQEQKDVTANLDGDRTRLKTTASPNGGFTTAQAAAMRKQAQEEADATLKQIEAGEE